MSSDTLSVEAGQVRRRAADLAGELSRAARRSATIAQERAILRMVGVDGLDRAGHPLAAAMVESYCGPDNSRLARGVILPFVVAMLEYDMPARDPALEVASGAIDLGLEAELLQRPERLAAAEAAPRLLAAALARFDANRTAARDLRDVLGLPDEPWLGVALQAAEVGTAAEETKLSWRGRGPDPGEGSGQLGVRRSAPPGRSRYARAVRSSSRREAQAVRRSMPVGDARPRARGRGIRPARSGWLEPVPAGSQRGLAELRRRPTTPQRSEDAMPA